MFETLIIQPIFNLLLILETAVGDFGIAIILFTVIIRLLMWPMLKKQLHHGKIMRKLQPEIKAIREKHRGDSQTQSQELMNLYKKHGVSPLGSFGLLLIQIPVFIGLFSALRSIIVSPERIIRLPYEFVANNQTVQNMMQSVADKSNAALGALQNPDGSANTELANQVQDRFGGGDISVEDLQAASPESLNQLFNDELIVAASDGAEGVEQLVQGPFFEQELFGFIDLSGQAVGDGMLYIPVLIIAVLAGVFQYFQTKQLVPSDAKNAKTVREIMREAAKDGKEPDQSELSAAMNRRMGLFFAPLITLISATSPAGLALYFASSGLVGLIQQRFVLKDDLEEMELVADVTDTKPKKKTSTSKNKKSSNSKKKTSKNKRGS